MTDESTSDENEHESDENTAQVTMNRPEWADTRETPKTRDIIKHAADPEDVEVIEDAPIDDGTDPGDAVEVTFSHGVGSRTPTDDKGLRTNNHGFCSRCGISLTVADMEDYQVEFTGSRPFTYCRACYYDLMRAALGEVVDWPPEDHQIEDTPENTNHGLSTEELMLTSLENGYVRHDLVLALVRAHPDPVVEAYDIAEFLPITTTTVHERLTDLVEDGKLRAKDMRANRKVFWDDTYTEKHNFRGPLLDKVQEAWENAEDDGGDDE